MRKSTGSPLVWTSEHLHTKCHNEHNLYTEKHNRCVNVLSDMWEKDQESFGKRILSRKRRLFS
jgi:hypothetical protein